MNKLKFDESKLLKPGNLSYQTLGEISFVGLSLTGESHLQAGTPCQDANYIRIANTNHPTIVAAIADGVGSCALSNYGSSIAVKTSTEYLLSIFNKLDISKTEDKIIGDYIRKAMQMALDAVNEEARVNQQLPYSYQSTLTIAIYDGKDLYFGHAGDDGIVALTSSGKLLMITDRLKGEEASSVYPLQSGKGKWQVGKSIEPIDGFMMATDGILDAVVKSAYEHNRIYYPFMEPAFNGTDGLEIGTFYAQAMRDQDFSRQVTDDMTVVFVKNGNIKNNPYRFNLDQWNTETAYYEAQRQRNLYGNNKGHHR